MRFRLVSGAPVLLLVVGCALEGRGGAAQPAEGAGSPAAASSRAVVAMTNPPSPPPATQAGASTRPAPIDDFEADLAAAVAFLVGRVGGSPADYALVESTFATVPRSGEKLWAAKFTDQPTGQVHLVYRDSGGAVGGVELWKAHFDPPLPTPRPADWGLPDPGTPYTGAELLNLLNFTPVPLPPPMTSLAAMELIAHEIWTWDGARYDDLSLSGSCGQDTCTVEIGGGRSGARGSDVHGVVVAVPDLVTRSAGHSLSAYPAALDPKLEDLARQLVAPQLLRRMTYRGAQWHLRPEPDQYTLTFAVDDTEGSPGKRVTLDLLRRMLISIEDFTF
jgi:hypothetical protein